MGILGVTDFGAFQILGFDFLGRFAHFGAVGIWLGFRTLGGVRDVGGFARGG